MKQLQVNVRTLKPHEMAAHFNRPKMSQGEQAARAYLGRKQAERVARVDSYFLAAWAVLFLGAICSPFFIIWGVK